MTQREPPRTPRRRQPTRRWGLLFVPPAVLAVGLVVLQSELIGRVAARALARADTATKDRALLAIAARLRAQADKLIAENLHDVEKAKAEGKNWKTDSSGGMIRVFMKNHGCHPFGNAKARAVVWNFPDPIPQHREPLYGNRPDLMAKYPTHDDRKAFWRLPTLFKTAQDKATADKIPLITMGYGRSESQDGSVFGWNFPLGGTYWDAADMLVQHLGKK